MKEKIESQGIETVIYFDGAFLETEYRRFGLFAEQLTIRDIK